MKGLILIAKNLSSPVSELVLDSHFEPTLFERLTTLTNIQTEAFITQPEELKLELLFYKRVSENAPINQTDLWLQTLKLKFGAELANILWHNNHRFLNFESKQWVLDSHEKIIDYAETKKTELKNYFPDLSESVLLKFLQCGLWIEYIDAFELSKTNLLKLTYPRKKEALLLMLKIKTLRPELSAYDCKELTLHHPKRWEAVLLEIEKIKMAHPHLSEGYCKQLAIGYFKTWPQIITLAEKIKTACPDLNDHACRKLAVSYKNSWPNVLEETKKIKGLHAYLTEAECEDLAINAYKSWPKILAEIPKIKIAHPDLSDSDCKTLAIRYKTKWPEVLKEVDRIKKAHPSLSDYDCKVLAIHHRTKWPKVLAEVKKIKAANPELEDYYCKKLAITYFNTWPGVLKEAEKIESAYPELTRQYSLFLAIGYYKTWKNVIAEFKKIKTFNPSLSYAQCLYLAVNYHKSWPQRIEKFKVLLKNKFIEQHFSNSLLLKLVNAKNHPLKTIYENFEKIIDLQRSLSVENSYQLRNLDILERKQFYFSLALLNSLSNTPLVYDKDNNNLSEHELLLWFKSVLVLRLGKVGYQLIEQIKKATFAAQNFVFERDYFNNSRWILIAGAESVEETILKKENTQEFSKILSKLLTPQEYATLIDYSFEEPVDPALLKRAIEKIQNSPQSQFIREHLQRVVG